MCPCARDHAVEYEDAALPSWEKSQPLWTIRCVRSRRSSHWTSTSGSNTFHGCRAGGDASPLRGRIRGRLLAVPGDRAFEPLAQRRSCFEAEQLPRARGVDAPPRLSIRLRGVPFDSSGEADHVRDERRELADRDLLRRAEVHRISTVVAVAGEHERLGAVVDVEELARRRAVSPQNHFLRRLEHLADQV